MFLMDVKAKYFFGDQNAGHGDKMVEVLRRRERHRGGLTGPGGHSENLEARRSFLRGSWRLCPPVPRTTKSCQCTILGFLRCECV